MKAHIKNKNILSRRSDFYTLRSCNTGTFSFDYFCSVTTYDRRRGEEGRGRGRGEEGGGGGRGGSEILTIAFVIFCLLLTYRPILALPEYKSKVVNICKMHGTGSPEVVVLLAV